MQATAQAAPRVGRTSGADIQGESTHKVLADQDTRGGVNQRTVAQASITDRQGVLIHT